jgi:hypothetical protein
VLDGKTHGRVHATALTQLIDTAGQTEAHS